MRAENASFAAKNYGIAPPMLQQKRNQLGGNFVKSQLEPIKTFLRESNQRQDCDDSIMRPNERRQPSIGCGLQYEQ